MYYFCNHKYMFAFVWCRLFSSMVSTERTKLMQHVEGQAFWMHLRMYASFSEDVTENDLRILDMLKKQGELYAGRPSIDQYIRSVQRMYKERVSEANAYVKSFRQFRTQPANGKLIIASVSFNVTMM